MLDFKVEVPYTNGFTSATYMSANTHREKDTHILHQLIAEGKLIKNEGRSSSHKIPCSLELATSLLYSTLSTIRQHPDSDTLISHPHTSFIKLHINSTLLSTSRSLPPKVFRFKFCICFSQLPQRLPNPSQPI